MTMPNSCLSSVTERPRCSRRSSARRRCIGRLARGTSASGTLGTSRIRLGIQQTMKCGSRNSVTTCAGEPHARIDGRRRKPAPFGTSRRAALRAFRPPDQPPRGAVATAREAVSQHTHRWATAAARSQARGVRCRTTTFVLSPLDSAAIALATRGSPAVSAPRTIGFTRERSPTEPGSGSPNTSPITNQQARRPLRRAAQRLLLWAAGRLKQQPQLVAAGAATRGKCGIWH